MEDPHNLQRFINAQETSYNTALNETQNGLKISHWMWYIFPQYKNLGRSATSKHYAIKSKEEAIAYLNHDVLGSRLIVISKELLKHKNKSANDIFGWPDDVKLKSCMSLFALIQDETDIFQKVLDKYFDGKISYSTKKMISE